METMAFSPYVATPQTSNLRTSTLEGQQGTRATQETPASQESFASVGSSNGTRMQSSSSNTNYTDLTSPISNAPLKAHDQYPSARSDAARWRTPEGVVGGVDETDVFAVASPMSLSSPASINGAKRTASGQVKTAPSVPNTPLTATLSGQRSRTNSLSSTGSRAVELAASLKTSLGYAMHKVQNGWEHKDINEVEKLSAYKTKANRHSMSHLDYARRPGSSGLGAGLEGLSMYGAYSSDALDGMRSPPSKRRSGLYSSFAPSSSQPTLGAAPQLQPAADIRPSSSQRHYHTAPSSQTNGHTSVMSPPRTPIHTHPRRPPTIRTDTQTAEAERDALQALFQLGSPHTSQASRQFASQASSSQASPLRSEFATPRRVTFARSESDSSNARASSDESSAPGL